MKSLKKTKSLLDALFLSLIWLSLMLLSLILLNLIDKPVAVTDCSVFHHCTMLCNISICIQCTFNVYSINIQLLHHVV